MKINSTGRTAAKSVPSVDVYRRLKTMVLTSQLQAGERLVERELARRLQVSRIPLREALIRLEGEGLVRSVANTATYVEDFSPHDVVEIYSLRLVLEPLATRLAAHRTTAGLVAALREICDRMTTLSKRSDWKKLDLADYEFHHRIVVASQHRRLIRAYDHCQIRIGGREFEYEGTKLKNLAPDHTAKQHERILTAIERGDGAEAEKASREHVDGSMQVLLAHYGFIVQATGKRSADH